MKNRFILIFSMALLFVAGGSVPVYGGDEGYIDFGRMAAWDNYSKRSAKVLRSQQKLQALMAAGHKTLTEQNKQIVAFQRQFVEYLDSTRNLLAAAAEIYGLYYEIRNLSKNIGYVSTAIADHPTNVFAVAVSKYKNDVYINVVTNIMSLISDVRMICFDEVKGDDGKTYKLTQKQRTFIMKGIRPKVRVLNRQLRSMAQLICDTSFLDVWDEITGRAEIYALEGRKAIMRRCLKDWNQKIKRTSDIRRVEL